jgi:hypothetical protein
LPERDNWSGTSSVSSLTVNGALVTTSYFPCVPQLPNTVCVHVCIRVCSGTARLHGLTRVVAFFQSRVHLTSCALMSDSLSVCIRRFFVACAVQCILELHWDREQPGRGRHACVWQHPVCDTEHCGQSDGHLYLQQRVECAGIPSPLLHFHRCVQLCASCKGF